MFSHFGLVYEVGIQIIFVLKLIMPLLNPLADLADIHHALGL